MSDNRQKVETLFRTLATLPFYHRDPFDRLIIAQAITENIPVVSIDAAFDSYGLTRLW
jgi:PIN domain nuclease of toxin-antitoxin system